MLLGSIFDANSLGKWIDDWTVYHHGPATPFSDISGKLWLLLVQLAGKVKRAEEYIPHIRRLEDKGIVDDFILSGERLTDKLKTLLKACEAPILKAGRKGSSKTATHLGKNTATDFVDSIFGRDRQLDATEKFMASIRLWNMRFDVNCEYILQRPGQSRER
ncbi:vegetative cell wall gp1 protein [Rutstroemia sp. NJR-2017a BBW]|nr:vegetative cell wall gp1 protein [Rutstroemia sp. NJR-2017a BBW]